MLMTAVLLSLATYLYSAEASRKRHDTASLQSLVSNVAAAEYAAHIATEGQDTAVYYCGLQGHEATLNEEGINGTLGQLLACELAVGVIVFPDPKAALVDLQATLIGLESLSNGTHVRNLSITCDLTTISSMEDAGLDGIAIWDILCNTTAFSTAPSVSSALSPISANTSSAASAGLSPVGTVQSAGTAGSASIGLPLTGNQTLTLTPASGLSTTAAGSTAPSPLLFSSVNASAGISLWTNGSLVPSSSFTAWGSAPSSQTVSRISAATSLLTSSQPPRPASKTTTSISITSPATDGSSSGTTIPSLVTTTSTAIATGDDGALTETEVVWVYVTVFGK